MFGFLRTIGPSYLFPVRGSNTPCDYFSSTRTISRRRDSVKLCRAPLLSKQGWRRICSTLERERGGASERASAVQSTVAKGPSISICRTSSSSSLCAADHKRVIYAAADGRTGAAPQKSYKVNNVVAAKILRDPSKGSKERKKCSLSFRLPSSLPPSLPRRTCAVSLASSRWQF